MVLYQTQLSRFIEFHILYFIWTLITMIFGKLIIFQYLFDHVNACNHLLTLWVEEKLASHIQKSTNIIIKQITILRYEMDGIGESIIKLDVSVKECSFNKFQLSYVTYTHVALVVRF